MIVRDRQTRGRDLFERGRWGDAFAELSAAQREQQLNVEDVERLAVAAYMVGRYDACEGAWTAAHRGWLRQGDPERAACAAFRHALELFFRGDLAPATGWVARGRRVLDGAPRDCVAHAWLLMLTALPSLFSGDGGAYASFAEAEEIGVRHADADAATFARVGQGYAVILQGRTTEGMALLDEVMVAVTSGDVSPVLAGITYCQVISLCRTVFDLRRAREWTDALTRWCHSQPDLVPYQGNCLIHRCEILQLQGAWRDARESAQRACDSLLGPPAWDTLGSAYYQLAEIQRLRGEFAEAEESYRKASLAGRDPEPGMALLRLGQNRIDLALPSILRVMKEAADPVARARLLPAYIEIMVEAGDVWSARVGADELARIAAELDAPYVHALSDHASGGVLLSEGNAQAALRKLRSAHEFWRDLEAPHQAARVRVLIGCACSELGDSAGAELELEAARSLFAELGAAPELERLSRILGSPPTGPLSRREREVLALVAAGKRNKAIADELYISEKTVARHVSNIFMKLGLASRAEAAAYAHKHGFVR